MTLELNDNEMDYLFTVLAQRPWGEANALMVIIQRQVQEQQNANADGIIEPDEQGQAG